MPSFGAQQVSCNNCLRSHTSFAYIQHNTFMYTISIVNIRGKDKQGFHSEAFTGWAVS